MGTSWSWQFNASFKYGPAYPSPSRVGLSVEGVSGGLWAIPGVDLCPATVPILGSSGSSCSCPSEVRQSPNYRPYNYVNGMYSQNADGREDRCFPQEYKIKLSHADGSAIAPSGLEIEPSTGMPPQTVALMARVLDAQNQPVPDIRVRIEVNVDTKSGGHDHGNDSRPRGSLGGSLNAHTVTGSTEAAGFPFSFSAPAAAGDHTITATCVEKSCGTETKKIWVGIKDLYSLPASHPQARYVLIGETDEHLDNHYLTVNARLRLYTLVLAYQVAFPGAEPLHLNDASLEWGGIFDLAGNWTKSPRGHAEHQRGTVIDIRANNEYGAIPVENFAAFKKLAEDMGAHAKIHSEGEENQHFHVRLRGVAE